MSGSEEPRVLTCDDVREMAGAFVLGALDAAEDAAVRAHLETCADLHAEIAELGGVLPALAVSVPLVEPPAGLRARIMAAAAADLAAGTAAAAPPASVEPAAPPLPSPAAAVAPPAPIAFPTTAERVTGRSRASTTTWILRIAAVFAIVALGGWNLLLRAQLDSARAYEQGVAAVLEVAAEPGSLTVVLTGDRGTGSGLAAIDAAGNVTMVMQDLAPTSGSSVYETWVIASDGVPVPLGSFTVGRDGIGSFAAGGLPTSPGIILALTREPGPGATTPTPPIISKGAAG